MNENLNFWRIWERREIGPLLFAFLIILVGILLGIFGWNQSLEAVLNWDVYSELNQKPIDNAPYFFQNLQFSSTSNVLYITERYLPSLMQVPYWVFYFVLFCALMGLSYMLVGFSRVQGLSFFAGMLILAVLLISMRFENVFLATHNYHFFGIFLSIGLFQYCFNAFFRNKSTVFILMSWALVWLVILAGIHKFSGINQPFVSLAAYGLSGMFIITLLFIVFVSHEAFMGMVWMISQNAQKGKSNLNAYFLVSVIFILNLLLVYFENSKSLESSSFIIAPIFIFFINVVLGLWGLKKYLDQTEILSFRQIGVWMYLGAGMIAAGTVAFIYLTGNDSLQELFEDAVSISSLVLSLCFFVHVLINFIQLFKQGLAVHKVIYKSPFSKFYLARAAGLFGVILLFSFKEFYSIYQFKAGQNNAIGDFHALEGDTKMAETFYMSAAKYDGFNHKSNLSMASIALAAGDKLNAGVYFNQSIKKIPNAFAYAGLSNCLESENYYFESIFTLQKGIAAFPNEHRLITNLAYLQAKAKAVDSVYLNLVKASKLCISCGPEQTNLLSFWIKNGKKEILVEKTKDIPVSKDMSFLANAQAIALIANEKTEVTMPKLGKDSALNVSQLAYIINSAANAKVEKGLSLTALKNISQKAGNETYGEGLAYAIAQEQYYRDSKIEGLKKWYGLTNLGSKTEKIYQQNLGLMLIKEGVLDKGLIELEKAGDMTSVQMIRNQKLDGSIDKSLIEQAEKLSSGLSVKNYNEILNKAPLNPYLITKVSDVLIKGNKAMEAYNIAFYATDFLGEHAEVLKSIFKSGVALSQFEYANDALQKLQGKISSTEWNTLKSTLDAKQVKVAF